MRKRKKSLPVRSKTALEIRELKKTIGIRKLFALLANLIAFISPCENSARKKAKKGKLQRYLCYTQTQ